MVKTKDIQKDACVKKSTAYEVENTVKIRDAENGTNP